MKRAKRTRNKRTTRPAAKKSARLRVRAVKQRARRRGKTKPPPDPDLLAGVEIPELPEGTTRKCGGCGATLNLAVCPVCQLRDLLGGRRLHKVYGVDDAPHSTVIGLDLRPEEYARYLAVRMIHERFPGRGMESVMARAAAFAELVRIEAEAPNKRKGVA